MAVNTKKVEGKKMSAPVLDVGLYPARLVQVIDLGLQPGYLDGPPKEACWLTYELNDEFMKNDEGNDLEDKPRWVSEQISVSFFMAEKAKSTERLNALDPKNEHDGDFTKMLGAPCNVNLGHNPDKKDPNKVYEKVLGITPMRDKDAKKLRELVNDPVVFDLDSPDMSVFNKLPEFLQKRITSNLRYPGSALAEELGDKKDPVEIDDEIKW